MNNKDIVNWNCDVNNSFYNAYRQKNKLYKIGVL
jgi:hypothetical protein